MFLTGKKQNVEIWGRVIGNKHQTASILLNRNDYNFAIKIRQSVETIRSMNRSTLTKNTRSILLKRQFSDLILNHS